MTISEAKSGLEVKIAARYSNVNIKRKNITFNIDEELLERLDSIVNIFYERDGITTRNSIIEDALTEYIQTAEDFFEKHYFSEDSKIKNPDLFNFDTAIFPALNYNFNKVFLGEHKWYYVRIAEHRINYIKYIALYRGAPVSAITHYAEVVNISNPNQDNKRIIYVNEPIELLHPISLGNIHVNNVRKLFYTNIEKLKTVNSIEELL